MTDSNDPSNRPRQSEAGGEFQVAVLAPESRTPEPADRLVDSDPFDVYRPDPDDGSETLASGVDCVVVAADRPDAARDLLADVEPAETPVVVAPEEGTERLAAVAVRHGATDYVPPSDGATLPDRVLAAVDEDDAGESDDDNDDRSRFRDLLAERLPDEAFLIDEDGYYLEATVRPEAADLYTVSADELVGHHLTDVFPDELAADLQACQDRAIETDEVQSIEYTVETVEGTRWYEARVVPYDEPVDGNGNRAVVWLGRDVTERVERERTLRRQRDHLETLNGINRVVRQVIHTLVEASTREAIEREACRQLVESELYAAAWIGERDGDDVAVRTAAGEATTLLEAVRDPAVEDERPVRETLETGMVRTSNRLPEEPRVPERLREAAREDDVTSAIAVPIEHDTANYGALVVYASREDAFSPREEDAFRLLGETIGFAINAVKNRRLLFADSVVELEVRVEHGDSISFHLSETYDCTCSLEWIGETAGGKIYQYVTVDGLDGETVMAAASDHDSVAECRLVHDGSDRATIELRLHESGARTLTNYGATIREITVTDGVGTALLEVPRDADVREVVDALRTVYDDVTMTARREVDRPVRTADERRERIVDRLTDRQLTALRLAYYGGYFDWPRASTGEDLADAMDVSPPTLHQHLRKAQQVVLTEFFGERSATD